ncbi:hypothetical protein L6452_09066 [Arctium lappa]|uniref:Uncharacterized protein n=1 Tax=Arctium lappa TaxID=4217 RepID=A0ACB9DJT2_ARCLA|nr:hypothetical protein L6452_09066 [Arctium lappa]
MKTVDEGRENTNAPAKKKQKLIKSRVGKISNTDFVEGTPNDSELICDINPGCERRSWKMGLRETNMVDKGKKAEDGDKDTTPKGNQASIPLVL